MHLLKFLLPMACEAVRVDEREFGGEAAAAWDHATLEVLLSRFGVDAASAEHLADVEAQLATYESEWDVRIPNDIRNLVVLKGVADAVAQGTNGGVTVFTPGQYGLHWALVAPWGVEDRRRAIASAIQEGQGCFNLYLVFDAAAVGVPETCQAYIGDFEWSELSELFDVPGTMLRLSTNKLYAFICHAKQDVPV